MSRNLKPLETFFKKIRYLLKDCNNNIYLPYKNYSRNFNIINFVTLKPVC